MYPPRRRNGGIYESRPQEDFNRGVREHGHAQQYNENDYYGYDEYGANPDDQYPNRTYERQQKPYHSRPSNGWPQDRSQGGQARGDYGEYVRPGPGHQVKYQHPDDDSQASYQNRDPRGGYGGGGGGRGPPPGQNSGRAGYGQPYQSQGASVYAGSYDQADQSYDARNVGSWQDQGNTNYSSRSGSYDADHPSYPRNNGSGVQDGYRPQRSADEGRGLQRAGTDPYQVYQGVNMNGNGPRGETRPGPGPLPLGKRPAGGYGPVDHAESAPGMPMQTNFSRRPPLNGTNEYDRVALPEPISASELQPPGAQWSLPDRPGSAPGFRAGGDSSVAVKSSNNYGHQYANSAAIRMPNFDKVSNIAQSPTGTLHTDPPSGPLPYPPSRARRSLDGPRNAQSPSGNAPASSWGQTDDQPPANFSRGLQKAATTYDEPLRPPPPRRNMTNDSYYSEPGLASGSVSDQVPGIGAPPQYRDPRGPPRDYRDVGDGFGSDGPFPPMNPSRGMRDGGMRNRDMKSPPPAGARDLRPTNEDRGNGNSPMTFSPPPGARTLGGPPARDALGYKPDNGPPGPQPGQPNPNFPVRGNSGGAAQRPPPMRPGLEHTSSLPNDKPLPLRQYGNQPSNRPATDSTARQNSVDQHKAPLDGGKPKAVTQAEISQLRATAGSHPSSNKVQMKLAKKLVEASVVLSDEGGRADTRTTAKNREKYILEAHRIIKKLVAGGDTEAMFYLADSLGSGSLGLENDPKESFNLYQQAAKAGHAQAAYRTAVCCEIGPEEGGGTRKDPIKAMQWYKRASALGDVPAMFKLGIIQLKGLLGQERNVVEACTWLKRAADHADEENPHAVHELGLLYETGTGPGNMPRDEAKAFQMYSQAAKLGYKASQFKLGQAYEYGLFGCPIDARNSIVWYTRAAAQGEHQSELALSGWYLTGSEGILEHSDTEAYLWARKAATAELPKAMFAMGYYTEVGIGCPSSLEEAKRWYGRAASYKFPKAQERLEELRRGGSKAQKNRERLSRSNQRQIENDCTVM